MPKQYSEMVVSRLQDAGVHLDDEVLAAPERAPMSDLIVRAVSLGLPLGLLFSQSPVLEATMVLASSTT